MSAIISAAASGNRKARVSACTAPILPAPMIPICSLGLLTVVLLVQKSRVVWLDRPQVIPVAPCALLRRAHPGQDVLLDQCVPLVVLRLQPAQHRGKVRRAHT